MPIIISSKILDKLNKKSPSVSEREIEQCFDNRVLSFLEDTREQNKTNPVTLWFVSTTNKERLLKVVFVQKGNDIFIKTAYDPNPVELQIYMNKA